MVATRIGFTTFQLDSVSKPGLPNVRSMMEVVLALENVGFVPEFSSTSSSAAKLWSSACPLAIVRREPQPVAQALETPKITTGRFSRASSVLCSSIDIASFRPFHSKGVSHSLLSDRRFLQNMEQAFALQLLAWCSLPPQL